MNVIKPNRYRLGGNKQCEKMILRMFIALLLLNGMALLNYPGRLKDIPCIVNDKKIFDCDECSRHYYLKRAFMLDKHIFLNSSHR